MADAKPRARQGVDSLSGRMGFIESIMKQEKQAPKQEEKKEAPKLEDANKGKWKGELPIMPWDKKE
jgi:hypothetical protein